MNEIYKLIDLLEENNIPYEFINHSFKLQNIKYPSFQVCCPTFNDRYISVIQSFGSYGGEYDLLEIMELLTEEEKQIGNVKGYLSAEEVYMRIKKHLEKEKRDAKNNNDR